MTSTQEKTERRPVVRGAGRPGELVQTEIGDDSHPAVVLVRGYLNRPAGVQRERWLAAIRGAGLRGPIYEFAWDASKPQRFVTNVWRLRDWRQVTERARGVGSEQLAAALGALPGHRLTLIGASAGARVVFHALRSPLLHPGKVHAAWLLGAALERQRASDEWEGALARLSGALHNVYYPKDWVLSSVYPAVTQGRQACGVAPIEHHDARLFNWDASRWMDGQRGRLASHAGYARALTPLLKQCHESRARSVPPGVRHALTIGLGLDVL